MLVDGYEEKIDNNLINLINDLENPTILELGVQLGVSTNKFLMGNFKILSSSISLHCREEIKPNL